MPDQGRKTEKTDFSAGSMRCAAAWWMRFLTRDCPHRLDSACGPRRFHRDRGDGSSGSGIGSRHRPDSLRGSWKRDFIRGDGRPLQAPVGSRLLGRMFNVFGQTIDGRARPEDLSFRTVHQAPIPLSQRVTKRKSLLPESRPSTFSFLWNWEEKPVCSAAPEWAKPF